MQHRAALRARARRAKKDYWTKMRQYIVFFAFVGPAIRRARIRAIGQLFGGFIRDMLNQESFADKILPVVEYDEIFSTVDTEREDQ